MIEFFGRDKTFYSPYPSLAGIDTRLCYQACLRDASLVVKYTKRLCALCWRGLLSRPPSLERSKRRGGLLLTNSPVVSMFERSENIAIVCRQSLLRQWRSIFLLWARSTIKRFKGQLMPPCRTCAIDYLGNNTNRNWITKYSGSFQDRGNKGICRALPKLSNF